VTAQEEERERILAALRRHAPALAARGVRGLLLFGSVARGEADQASDVDIAGGSDAAGTASRCRTRRACGASRRTSRCGPGAWSPSAG
jgi:hypothetical protein